MLNLVPMSELCRSGTSMPDVYRAESMRIRLRLPAPPALRRWHVALASHLAASGHCVMIEYAAAEPLPGWVDLLCFVEQRLYASRAVGESDMLAPAQPPADAPATARGVTTDLCIDCVHDVAQDLGLTLRPGIAGGRIELQALAAALDGHPPHVGWRAGASHVASGQTALTATHIHSQSVSEALARTVSMVGPAIANALAGVGDSAALRPGAATPFDAAAGLTRALAGRVQAAIARRLRGEPQWNVGWRALPAAGGVLASAAFDASAYRWLARDPAHYLADPFAVAHDGQRALFVEQFPYATGRGIISVLAIGPDGPSGTVRPVLERPHHLSYPCIFSHSGALWMLPESAGAQRLELFRCERFPDRWALHAVLFEGQTIADATFFEHGGRCWLAGALADGGASDRDALALWHAPHPEGPWTPHSLNPVRVDVATARPAGWVERIGGRLRRPAQDCTHGYGWGLSLLEIETLTPDTFRERTLARLPPPASLGARAFHTLNTGAGLEVIDAVL